jgi:hypothetical protein
MQTDVNVWQFIAELFIRIKNIFRQNICRENQNSHLEFNIFFSKILR